MPSPEAENTITLTRLAEEGGEALLHLPRRLGPVQLIRQIGRGGMGEVWLGRHTVLARDVAVKFLLHAVGGADDPHFERFLQEARTAAAVRHPHLVLMYDANLWGELPYLVMEYIDGPTLSDVLRRRGALSVPQTLAVLEAVAGAVGQLHDREIVHRDIKPSNILLDRDGRVVVSDFGLACGRAAAGTGAVIAGTPAYMAPEMFEGRASPRSDVYALGIMAFQLLPGELPFTGSLEEVRQKHTSDALPVEMLLSRRIDSALIDVIVRAAHKNPTFRYKTAAHLLRGLKEGVPDANVWIRGAESLVNEAARHRSAPAAEPTTESKTPSTSYYEHLASIATTKRRLQGRATPEELVPPALGPVELLTQGRTLTVDLRCAECNYNLKGLDGAQPCPECGTPIEQSLGRERLMFADTKWLRRVKVGIFLLAGGILFGAAVSTWSTFAWDITLSKEGWALVLFLTSTLPFAVPIAGLFLVTTPEPDPPTTKGTISRKVGRAAAGLTIAAILVSVPLGFAISNRGAYFIAGALALVSAVSAIRYVRVLGKRIPDRRVVRSARDVEIMLLAVAASLCISALLTRVRLGASPGLPILYGVFLSTSLLPIVMIPWVSLKLLVIARVFKRQVAGLLHRNALFGQTEVLASAATKKLDESEGVAPGDGRVADIGACCRRCGYQLYGLRGDGQCPECGAAISPSLEGELLRFADPVWLARLARGNRILLWSYLVQILGIFPMWFLKWGPLTWTLEIIFDLLGVYGAWLLTTPEPSRPSRQGFRNVGALIRMALLVGVLVDVGRVCLTLLPESQLSRLWLNAIHSGLGSLMSAVVIFLLFSYYRSLAERVPDDELIKRARWLLWSLPACIVLAAPGNVASGLGIHAQEMPAFAWKFGIVARGVAGVLSMLFGLLAVWFQFRIGKKLYEQAALARATWTPPDEASAA